MWKQERDLAKKKEFRKKENKEKSGWVIERKTVEKV